MNTILEASLPKMAATHAKLLAYVAGLDEAAANQPVGPEQWSTRQMVGHLVDAERAHRRFIETVAAGAALPTLENFDRDAWNADRVARRNAQSLAEIVAAYEAERAETVRVLEGLPEEAWAKGGHHPALGEITVEYAARIIGLHEQMHLKEMMG